MGSGTHRPACLVTGVAGFVGSHLAERLLALDYPVVGVDNFCSGFEKNIKHLKNHPGFCFHERSVTEKGLLEDLARLQPGLRICFHLAAIVSVPYSVEHPEETMEVNYHATVRLLEEAGSNDLAAFVFAGSAAEYGDDPRLPLSEEFASHATHHLSPYGRAKFLASKAVAATPIGASLRCFNIFGPRQDPGSPYSGVISKFIDMALNGQPLTIFGDGLQTRDFIYVADIVEAYLLVAGLVPGKGRPPSGVYNVGTGRSISVLDLAEAVLEVTHRPKALNFLPERPGDIRHSVASIAALNHVGDWIPRVSLHEGLERTVKWMREDG